MTDFVMSKVALSLCALVVAVSMSSSVEKGLSPDPGADLERILAEIQDTVSMMTAHGGASSIEWRVPALPSGASVSVSFMEGGVLASAHGLARVAHSDLHVWTWDGMPLNSTRLEELGVASAPMEKRTGDLVALKGALVPLDDCLELLLFVS